MGPSLLQLKLERLLANIRNYEYSYYVLRNGMSIEIKNPHDIIKLNEFGYPNTLIEVQVSNTKVEQKLFNVEDVLYSTHTANLVPEQGQLPFDDNVIYADFKGTINDAEEET